MARIVFVRALKGYPDSRLEKEIYSLSKKHSVMVFGWDRNENYLGYRQTKKEVFGKEVDFYHAGIVAPVGLGFKKLFVPMLKFWKTEYNFLKINKDEYDVIHACDFDTAFIAQKIAKRYNKKIIYDIFDYYAESHVAPEYVKKQIKKIDDKLIMSCSATIICSEKRKEQIKDVRPKMLEIIHNTPMPYETETHVKMIEGEHKRARLVYVGLLSKDRFLEDIACVIKKRNDVEWHIGGWGVLDEYFSNIKAENITYYGKIPYVDAMELEKECDIMSAIYDPILPNHKYAAPNKFYEALMLKKPLIMLKGTGMDDYVAQNFLGEVIDLSKTSFAEGFDRALDKLLENKDFESIGNAGYELYEKEFSWNLMENRLLNLYKKVCHED